MQGTSVRLSLRYDGLELSSLMAATLYFLPLHSERKTNKSSNNGQINTNNEEAYSSVPNRCAGRNKRAGGKILEKH